MELFYSQFERGRLLHMVCRGSELSEKRANLTDPSEFLQLAGLRLSAGDAFRPHKHLPIERVTSITQESWVVIRGVVIASLFDVDDLLLAEVSLQAGDLSITFYGGHTYRCTEDALVYEFKTGPYLGVERDKVFIQGRGE
jgi:hypothetical protein